MVMIFLFLRGLASQSIRSRRLLSNPVKQHDNASKWLVPKKGVEDVPRNLPSPPLLPVVVFL
jgi:hypothetical protein